MLLTMTILAVEAGEQAEDSGINLLPDTAELIWGLVAFLLLFAVLSKLALPKMNAMLEERAALIQGRIEEAEATQQDAERLRRQYSDQLAEARNEAGRIIEEARGQAERLRADIVAKAEEEAGQIVQRSREDIAAERARLVQSLRGQVATLSVDLAGRIVQRELDEDAHRDLVDQYINDLSGMN